MKRLRVALDPTVLFLVLGIATFVGYRVAGRGRSAGAPSEVLRIDLAEVRAIEERAGRRLGRALTAEERAAEIDAYVGDELMAREALRLGLHARDPIIRRRLIQKLEFALESTVAFDARAGTELAQAAEGEGLAVSLEHRFFRDPAVAAAARLAMVADGEESAGAGAAAARDPGALGEAFPLGARLRYSSLARLEAELGPAFRAAAASLPLGTWSEPVRSPYGVHLFRVLERKVAPAPRRAPSADPSAQRRALERARAAFVAGLRAQAEVIIEAGASP